MFQRGRENTVLILDIARVERKKRLSWNLLPLITFKGMTFNSDSSGKWNIS